MSWTFGIGRIAGIPVRVHLTFVALLVFLFGSDWMGGRDLGAALWGLFSLLLVFAIIVLHELGHALTARRFGIRTKDITLLPIGGLARLERMPDTPWQDLLVALAGPAVNVVLALAAFLTLILLTQGGGSPYLDASWMRALNRLVWLNVWLAAFNMIPAFPMDGGRALRALLAMRLRYVRATQIAATLGQGLALVLGFIGLFGNPLLIFIALFIWSGAATEASATEMRQALSGLPVGHAMLTDFRMVEADAPLQAAVDLMMAGSQRDFPVVRGGTLVGMLTRDGLLARLAHDEHGHVSDAMAAEFVSVEADAPLEPAIRQLEQSRAWAIPVVQDGRLVGLLTLENVAELLMVQGARARRPQPA